MSKTSDRRPRRVARVQLRRMVRSMPAGPHTSMANALAMAICTNFFGIEWVEHHIMSSPNGGGFIAQTAAQLTRLELLDRHLYRVIELGEMLYNLQHVNGFDNCISQLKNGKIEDTIAELESAKLLFINNINFRFVVPQQQLGLDYDLEICLSDGTKICSDVKNKIETTEASVNTVYNSLKRGRRQLPSNCPSVIFLRVPAAWWIPESEDIELVREGCRKFLRETGRVVSVVIHTRTVDFISDQVSAQRVLLEEIENKNCRFIRSEGWSIFGQKIKLRNTRWKFLFPIVGVNPEIFHLGDDII